MSAAVALAAAAGVAAALAARDLFGRAADPQPEERPIGAWAPVSGIFPGFGAHTRPRPLAGAAA